MVHDLLIVGSGPVGTALALALRERGLDIALVDARGRGASVGDPRVLALSRGSCQTLQRLGAWQELDATPIRRIHVSQQGGFGRTLIDAKEVGVDALGQVVRAGELAGALDRALGNEGLTWIEGGRVAKITAGDDDVVVTLDGERPGAVRARLVACAEGAIDESAPGVRSRDYGQHAVITLATSERPHDHQAFERFTTGGPLALLPFGQRYAVVHTAPPDEAERLADLDDAAYIAEVERRLAGRVRLTRVDPRMRFPLMLRYRRHPIGERTVWLGNAAQTLHPVAGQGFNLALRDVWSLAAVLSAWAADDVGQARVLDRYARQRRLDRTATIGITDALVRVFSNDRHAFATARGAGLMALDACPPLRRLLARTMMFGARAWS
ncbi:MAG: FAD-dependent monooxygenase [Rhodocyclaceae bacterium]|nr:FAD-dependent monooxygenase [Rhodocyclaceae bacterium]